MACNHDLSKAYEAHIKIINALISDLNENKTTCMGDGVTMDFFWIKICLAVQGVSKEATNLCMIFSAPPPSSVKECEPLLRKLEGITVALVSAFYSLPLSAGLTLKKCIHEGVLDIVKAVFELSSIIADNKFESSQEQLQKTGSVWECCERFPQLPRDNCAAVILSIKETLSLVNDALQEMEEAQNEADGDDSAWNDILQEEDGGGAAGWSDTEKQIILPSLGLVKATKACLKKSVAAVKSVGLPNEQQVGECDEVNDILKGVSPAVDDVVACLYPPMDQQTVRQNAHDLSSKLKDLVLYLRESSLTKNTDETWLNFLTQANEHNLEKLCQLIPGD